MRIMRWGWIVLAGVVAEGVSIAFLVGPVPHNAEYFFPHGMKLVAGAAGGGVAGWQASARTRASVS